MHMLNVKEFIKNILSFRNSDDKNHKIITLFYIKIKFRINPKIKIYRKKQKSYINRYNKIFNIGCDFICVLSGETQRLDIQNYKDKYPSLVVKDISEISYLADNSKTQMVVERESNVPNSI